MPKDHKLDRSSPLATKLIQAYVNRSPVTLTGSEAGALYRLLASPEWWKELGVKKAEARLLIYAYNAPNAEMSRAKNNTLWSWESLGSMMARLRKRGFLTYKAKRGRQKNPKITNIKLSRKAIQAIRDSRKYTSL